MAENELPNLLERDNSMILCEGITCNYSFWEWSPQGNWTVKSHAEVCSKISVLAFIIVSGLIGNLVIISIVLLNPKIRQKSSNLFLLNMAVADFLNLLISPTLYLFRQDVIYRFYKLNEVACKLTPLFQVGFLLASALSLTVLTLCRLRGVVFPRMKIDFRKRTIVFILIAGIWITSAILACPTIFFRTYWKREWKDFVEVNCDDQGADTKNYWTATIAVMVWIPMSVMFASYGLIYLRIIQSGKAAPASVFLRRRKIIIRLLLILLTAEIICWTPWQIYSILEITQRRLTQDEQNPTVSLILPILHDVKYYIIFANSAIRPILYGVFSQNMRQAARTTFDSTRIKSFKANQSVNRSVVEKKSSNEQEIYTISDTKKKFIAKRKYGRVELQHIDISQLSN